MGNNADVLGCGSLSTPVDGGNQSDADEDVRE